QGVQVGAVGKNSGGGDAVVCGVQGRAVGEDGDGIGQSAVVDCGRGGEVRIEGVCSGAQQIVQRGRGAEARGPVVGADEVVAMAVEGAVDVAGDGAGVGRDGLVLCDDGV